MRLHRHWMVAVAALLVWQIHAITLQACEIPVFRYALERWAPDSYQVLVVHRKPLTSDQQRLVGELENLGNNLAKPANLQLVNVDLEAKSDDPMIKMLQENHKSLEPLMVVRQPHPMPEALLIWQGPLTSENIRRLVDSPARQELVHRLTDGHSAVWVLLETGNAEQDDAAAALVTRELGRLANELKLPDRQVLEADEYFKPETKVALRIEFSLLRLKPGDPKEAMLRTMLLASEADLKDQKEPIAMPVFGRGRACFALVGKGINAQQIEENCKFVTGRCSCQIKQENPGVDLLVAADWDKLVGGPTHPGGPIPELSGLGVLVVDVEPKGAGKPAGSAEHPTILGQKPITPVATEAAVQSTSHTASVAVPLSTPPSALAQTPATATPKAAPSASSAPSVAVPKLAEAVDATGQLMVWVAVVAGVGLAVALVGSLWLKRRGGAGS